MSLDGFIADSNGGFDWITGDGKNSLDTKDQFDFPAFLDAVDVIVMGKRSFLDCPKETLDSFKDKMVFVASNEPFETERSYVVRIQGDLVKQITALQQQKGKHIWLFGGAGLTDAFIKANVIDEYILGFIPILLGNGRPLFLENNPTVLLHLEEITSQEGIVVLRYVRR